MIEFFLDKSHYSLNISKRVYALLKIKEQTDFFALITITVVLFFLAVSTLFSQSNDKIEMLLDQLAIAESDNDARLIRKKIWLLWLDGYEDQKNKPKIDMALELFNRGDLEKADRAFSEIIALEPGYVEGWNKRATLKFLLGDFSGSLLDIQEVLKRQPRHFGAISGSGLIHIHTKNFEDAYNTYMKLSQIDPLNEDSKRFLPMLENKIFGKSL